MDFHVLLCFLKEMKFKIFFNLVMLIVARHYSKHLRKSNSLILTLTLLR